jgi:hypothetical protein
MKQRKKPYRMRGKMSSENKSDKLENIAEKIADKTISDIGEMVKSGEFESFLILLNCGENTASFVKGPPEKVMQGISTFLASFDTAVTISVIMSVWRLKGIPFNILGPDAGQTIH